MANITIDTTQNVRLQYKVASIGERILALTIDLFLFFLYFFLVERVLQAMQLSFFDSWSLIGVKEVLLLPVVFYSFYMSVLFEGRTIGKMILKIKVIKIDGSPAAWNDYMVRWLLRIVDIWMFSGIIGLFFILFTDNKQRLGDLASRMIVVSTKHKITVDHTILEEISEEHEPMFTQVTKLSDRDVGLIKETYRLAVKSSDYRTLKALRNRVELVLDTTSDLKDKEFIDRILHDYNYYTQNM